MSKNVDLPEGLQETATLFRRHGFRFSDAGRCKDGRAYVLVLSDAVQEDLSGRTPVDCVKELGVSVYFKRRYDPVLDKYVYVFRGLDDSALRAGQDHGDKFAKDDGETINPVSMMPKREAVEL